MIASQPSVETVSFYINGQWESAGNRKLAPVTNPATGAEIAQVAYATAEDVDRTVRAAHAAYLKWRDVPVVDRMQPLYRYKMLLEKNHHELASTLTTENGKTIDDARAEVRRAIQMVEVACGMPSLMMGDSLNDVSAGIDSHTIRQPLGVCAGITPFNFPAMVPMWMWPFAIAAGNAFILKPSEKVPMTPTLAAKLLHEAGLPAGVFNLIHGDKRAGAGRREESSGGDAGCAPAEDGGKHHQLGVRRRGRALPGGKRVGSSGRCGRTAAQAFDRKSQ
jgi:malonate-semialdehyde dehydrogenase (acetylating)/methylmalonate-semialdehyde dehydrogenase